MARGAPTNQRQGRWRPWRVLAVLLALAVALAAADVAANGGFAVTRYAFVGGGAVSSGDVRLSGTVGEAIVGGGRSGDVSVGGGYYAAPPDTTPAPTPTLEPGRFLPLVKQQ